VNPTLHSTTTGSNIALRLRYFILHPPSQEIEEEDERCREEGEQHQKEGEVGKTF
jgi:hypothetical protein